MNSKKTACLYRCSICLGIAFMWPSVATAAMLSFAVEINTTGLVDSPAGPFTLELQLLDGSGIGNGDNTVIVEEIDLGGGAFNGDPIFVGGAEGDASTSLTLSDLDAVNYFQQQFFAGSALNFSVRMTTNVDSGPFGDIFWVALLDREGSLIPTLGDLDTFVTVDVSTAAPSVAAYGVDPAETDLPIPEPSITLVPEPGMGCLSGLAIVLLLKRIRWHRSGSHG